MAFVKGKNGNPGGRPREVGDLRELARQRTDKALNTLEEIMLDRKAPHSARAPRAARSWTAVTGVQRSSLSTPGRTARRWSRPSHP